MVASKKGPGGAGAKKRVVQDTLMLDDLFRGATNAAPTKPKMQPAVAAKPPHKQGAPKQSSKLRQSSPLSSESDDDALYLQLFGAPAPPRLPQPTKVEEQAAAPLEDEYETEPEQQQLGPRPAASITTSAAAILTSRATPSATTTSAAGQSTQPVAAEPKSEDEDDFEVTFDDIDIPTPAPKQSVATAATTPASGAHATPTTQQRPGAHTLAPPSTQQQPGGARAAIMPATAPRHPNSRTYVLGQGGAASLTTPSAIPGLGVAAVAPITPGGPNGRPAVPPGLQANRKREEQQAAAAKATTPGSAATPAPGVTASVVPWARPQYVNVATGLMTTISLDAEAAFPTQAAPGQWLKLPKQTRVTPEEYREFLSLGHGEIFTLDLDRVIDAPWRAPNANPSDYFNYGMNERSWREYCRKVEQYRVEYSLRSKIVALSSDASSLYGGHSLPYAMSELPPEVAELLAKDWPTSPVEAEEASTDPGSGMFLDAPPAWPPAPSNRARTMEMRRTRARLDPEAIIELVKPEAPKEGEKPFGSAFPNIEYEEPARMQDRDIERFISLEESRNPASFKRDSEAAPLQSRMAQAPRPPTQPYPTPSVSPAMGGAGSIGGGLRAPESLLLAKGQVAEGHMRPAHLPLPQLQQQNQQAQPAPQQQQPPKLPARPIPPPSAAAIAAATAAAAAMGISMPLPQQQHPGGGDAVANEQPQQQQQHGAATQRKQQQPTQQQPTQQLPPQQQQPQPAVHAYEAAEEAAAAAGHVEEGALDERWQASAHYLPLDEDVFVGGGVEGLTAAEEEEGEDLAASYYDSYMGGGAAEGAFYGEEEGQEGLYDQQHEGGGQGVLDLLGYGAQIQVPAVHEYEEAEEEGHSHQVQPQPQQQQQQQQQQELIEASRRRAHSPVPKRPRSPRRSRSPSKRTRQESGSSRRPSARERRR